MYYSVLNINSSEFYNFLTGNYKADFRVAFLGSRSTTIHFNYPFLINNRTKPLETKYYFKKNKTFFLIIYYSTGK